MVFVSSFSDILNHEDLDGKIKTACLGSLLLQDHLNRLEDQYLAHKEVNTSKLKGAGVSCSVLGYLTVKNVNVVNR